MAIDPITALKNLGIKPDAGGDRPDIQRPPEGHYVARVDGGSFYTVLAPDETGNRVDTPVVKILFTLKFGLKVDNNLGTEIVSLQEMECSVEKCETAFFISNNARMREARAAVLKIMGSVWKEYDEIDDYLNGIEGYAVHVKIRHWKNSNTRYSVDVIRSIAEDDTHVASMKSLKDALDALDYNVTNSFEDAETTASTESNAETPASAPAPAPAPASTPTPSTASIPTPPSNTTSAPTPEDNESSTEDDDEFPL